MFATILGHYHCGGVKASLGTTQFGLIDNWLRTIKDVYRGEYLLLIFIFIGTALNER
jgi:carbonic anhydrase